MKDHSTNSTGKGGGDKSPRQRKDKEKKKKTTGGEASARQGNGSTGLSARRERRKQEKTLLKKKHRHANQLRKSSNKSNSNSNSNSDSDINSYSKNSRSEEDRSSSSSSSSKELPRKRRDRSADAADDRSGSSGISSSSSISSSSKSIGSNKLRKRAALDRERRKDEPSSDAFIDFEDMEIKRLEKLLGINKGAKNVHSQKLNKEYSMYEGIGEDFGDFLMKLDDINKKDRIFDAKDYEYDSDEAEEVQFKPHILDDDEQEKSDIEDEGEDMSDSEDDDDDDDEDEDDDMSDGDEVDDENNDEEQEDAEDEDDDDDDDGDGSNPNKVDTDNTYKPVAGEDIYGRVKVAEGTATSAKYVPPALRGAGGVQLATVDESSDKNRVLRAQIKGLMNRISDNTKDTIIRELKDLFQSNSTTVTSYLFREILTSLCANKTQVVTFIPLYASIVAALHFIVGLEVGAYIIEYFAVELHKMVEKERHSSEKSAVVSKVPCNYLLLLLYLYNYRIVHHSLIVDILNYLVADGDLSVLTSLDVELVAILIDHCGIQVRGDDPISLKASVMNLNKISASISSSSSSASVSLNSGVDNGRIRYLLDVVTDLKNNKSRRSQNANADVVKGFRKWLGGVKSALSSKPGDLTLKVGLKDLLDAELQGRWWRAGGAWAGASASTKSTSSSSSSGGSSDRATAAGGGGGSKESLFKKGDNSSDFNGSEEEKKLLKLAAKLRMTTTLRKNIFVLIMSSNDVNDAYEKIAKLDLKGKQDRDIVKVLCECCAQEKVYNEFYAELSCLLCKENRQFKTTFQFTFWDMFKTISEDGEETKPRRCINMGRLLARLVTTFHLPLSVIKPIDMGDIGDPMQLLLGSFFMALFTSSITEEEYQSVLDRVATTKDYSVVREGILLYLQTHLTSFPNNADSTTLPIAKKRRKLAISTMEAMGVLDFATAGPSSGPSSEGGGGGDHRRGGLDRDERDRFDADSW